MTMNPQPVRVAKVTSGVASPPKGKTNPVKNKTTGATCAGRIKHGKSGVA